MLQDTDNSVVWSGWNRGIQAGDEIPEAADKVGGMVVILSIGRSRRRGLSFLWDD